MIGNTLNVTPDPDIAWLDMIVLAPLESADGSSPQLIVKTLNCRIPFMGYL